MRFSDFFTILLTAAGLAADAFAVAVADGIAQNRHMTFFDALRPGFLFGFFQFLMPLLGYGAAGLFAREVARWDHVVALLLLGFLGFKMIFGARESQDSASVPSHLSARILLFQALATSLDAMAVGITYRVLGDSLQKAFFESCIIGLVTLFLSVSGMFLGRRFGCVLQKKAAYAGGFLLIIIGIKIFICDLLSNS